MKTILLLFAVLSFPALATPKVPLLDCTTPDAKPFRFVIYLKQACAPSWDGPVCGGQLNLDFLGFDPNTHQWTLAGSIVGLQNSTMIDKTKGVFTYHFSKDKIGHIDVDVSGDQSLVDIDLSTGFSTAGPLSSYRCEFL